MFRINNPLIIASRSNILINLLKNSTKDLPTIDLVHGNYKFRYGDIYQYGSYQMSMMYHESIDDSTLDSITEKIRLINHPVEDSVDFGYSDYSGQLQGILDSLGYSYDVQEEGKYLMSFTVIMDPGRYKSLENIKEREILDIFPPKEYDLTTGSDNDLQKLFLKTSPNSNCIIVSNKILIFYCKFTSQYDSDLLVKDANGLYVKPDDYMERFNKQEMIRLITEKYHTSELLDHLNMNSEAEDIIDKMIEDKLSKLSDDVLEKILKNLD